MNAVEQEVQRVGSPAVQAPVVKVVINECYGGFGLSHAAVMAYAERKGLALYTHADDISVKVYGPLDNPATYRGHLHYFKVPPEQYYALEAEIRANPGEDYKRLNEKDWYFSDHDIKRDDPDLVAVVEELGSDAYGSHAKLVVVEVPADAQWEIAEYDGLEHVAETHRVWHS